MARSMERGGNRDRPIGAGAHFNTHDAGSSYSGIPAGRDRRPVLQRSRRCRFPIFGGFSSAGAELLFVDDGSTDKPWKCCVASAPGVKAAPRCSNAARTEASRSRAARYARALQSGAAYAGYWDADLATPLDDIASF